MADPTPRITTFVLGDYQTNCFVITVPGAEGDAWVVDCGFEPAPLFAHLDTHGLTVRGLWLTHSHLDHIAGVDALHGRFGPFPVFMHEAERGFCSDPLRNLSAMIGANVTCAEPDHWLRDGDTVTTGPAAWTVRHAPGHSPGGAVYFHEPSRQAIVGDTLFAGSMGRIDFPTSDPRAMHHTLHEVIMKLPGDTTIHPGHGPATTIDRERATNMFLRSNLAEFVAL